MSMSDEHEQEALRAQVRELKFALQWERTQKERLLEEQSGFRREINRLQDRIADLERQLAEKSHQPAHS
jgi:chromosome segregation ATPase